MPLGRYAVAIVDARRRLDAALVAMVRAQRALPAAHEGALGLGGLAAQLVVRAAAEVLADLDEDVRRLRGGESGGG